MKRIIIFLLLCSILPIFASISDWEGKTPAQLSGMTDYVTIPNTDYWNTHAYLQIYDLINAYSSMTSISGVADTAALRLLADNEGAMRYLNAYVEGGAVGGGLVIMLDSTLTEGHVAFDCDSVGKQWVRMEYVSNKTVLASWFDNLFDAIEWAPEGSTIYGAPNTTDEIDGEENQEVKSYTTIILPNSYKMSQTPDGTPSEFGCLLLNGVNDVTIIGGELYGNAANDGNQTEHMHAVYIDSSYNVEITGMYIHGWAGDCIYIEDSHDVSIHHNNIVNTLISGAPLIGRQGISIVNRAGGWVDCYNIDIHNNIINGSGYASIDIEPNDTTGVFYNINITDNISDVGRAASVGNFGYAVVANCAMRHIKIARNRIHSATYGIWLYGRPGMDYVKDLIVEDNSVDSCSDYGVIGYYLDELELSRNTVSNCGTGMMFHYACEDVDIMNNNVHDNDGYGIYVSGNGGTALRFRIINNRVWNNSQETPANNEGILIVTADTVDVRGNWIYDDLNDTQARPMQISTASSVNISDNWSWGHVTSDDILLYAVTDTSLTFSNNRADVRYQETSTAQQDTMLQVLTSGSYDTFPTLHPNKIKGELTANAINSGVSDYGTLLLTAGGGTDSTYKAYVGITGYGTTDGNQIRIGAGVHEMARFTTTTSYFYDGASFGSSAVVLDSLVYNETTDSLYIYIGGAYVAKVKMEAVP